jgi:hypothetical protein
MCDQCTDDDDDDFKKEAEGNKAKEAQLELSEGMHAYVEVH